MPTFDIDITFITNEQMNWEYSGDIAIPGDDYTIMLYRIK